MMESTHISIVYDTPYTHGTMLDPSKTGQHLSAAEARCCVHHKSSGRPAPAVLALLATHGRRSMVPQPAVRLEGTPGNIFVARDIGCRAQNVTSRPPPQPAPRQVPQLVAAVVLAQSVDRLILQVSRRLFESKHKRPGSVAHLHTQCISSTGFASQQLRVGGRQCMCAKECVPSAAASSCVSECSNEEFKRVTKPWTPEQQYMHEAAYEHLAAMHVDAPAHDLVRRGPASRASWPPAMSAAC